MYRIGEKVEPLFLINQVLSPMFQKVRKNGSIVLLMLVVALLVGCGEKKEAGKTAVDKTGEEDVSIVTTPDLPEATGKVGDTISALEMAVTSENTIISQDESSAKNSVVDDQETSDFNQVYNESEF